MVKKTVTIYEVDAEQWQWFAGHCKSYGLQIGAKISDMIYAMRKEVEGINYKKEEDT